LVISEVTGERIRDKIAASKKRGIWMGGVVPLGYRVENRALHIVEEHAGLVRDLFRRYLEVGSVVRVQATLDTENVRLPLRTDGKGKSSGGGLISRGHLYKILSNPIYAGRLGHKGQVHDGQHAAILDQLTWDSVQSRLAEHAQRKTAARHQHSDALLAGKLFDDKSNRMSPSFAAKGGRRWRYYISRALLRGRKAEAGSLARVAAAEIEKQVGDAVNHHLGAPKLPDPDLRDAIERVAISATTITITLADSVTLPDSIDRAMTVRWTPPSSMRRREILQGDGDANPSIRPMRTKARVGIIAALRDAHRWLDELLDGSNKTIETIASREGKTERSIRMTLSLAFLAPSLVEAAMEGRLPRGFSVTRLTDLPMAWSEQWSALGLAAPTAA
jgi:site-specific DNA recombinase